MNNSKRLRAELLVVVVAGCLFGWGGAWIVALCLLALGLFTD